MEIIRKYILRIHGTALILVSLVATTNATLGVQNGQGFYGFLATNRVGYIGLLQAYLLAILTGIVLWTGSCRENRKVWNRVGCLFHFFILIVYTLFWNSFTTFPRGELIRNSGFAFHILFFTIEFWAGVLAKKIKHD